MAPPAMKVQKRRQSPPRVDAREGSGPEQTKSRLPVDRRSRFEYDQHPSSTLKTKGKAKQRTPPPKRAKFVEIEESDSAAQEAADDEDHDWSGGDDMAEAEDYTEGSDDSDSRSGPAHPCRPVRDRVLKKPVTLDVNGLPWGNMKECLSDDIKKYAKSLDPTSNWESQPALLRSLLFKRLYKDWDMLGQSYKLSEKWVGPIITKVLITTRWRLNTLIDAGQLKPADVTQEQWNTLVRRRSTEDSQVLSEHMRSISQGKGSKTAQLKAIERDTIVKLTLLHNRKPYQTEITDEVAREYTRQQLEKRKAALQKGADMDDVRSRVVDMEDNVSRLEEKIGASHKRMEDMLKSFMTAPAGPPQNVPNDTSNMPRSVDVMSNMEEILMNNSKAPGSSQGGGSQTRHVQSSVAEGACEDEDIIADVVEPVQKEVISSDGQDEEFLKVLLQEQDVVLGLPEGAKSTETVVLSARSDENQSPVPSHLVPEDGPQNASEANAGNITPLPQPEEEDGILDSSVRQRRPFLKIQPPKNVSGIGSGKLVKYNVSKSVGAPRTGAPPPKVQSSKKSDGSRKK